MLSTVIRGTLLFVGMVAAFGLSLVLVWKLKGSIGTVAYVNLGIGGTGLWVFSLGYVLRKYCWPNLGSLRFWLNAHILTGGTGYYLVVLHSDLHFRALVATLDFVVMTVIIISGLVGYGLYVHTLRTLNYQQVVWGKDGWRPEEIDGELAIQGAVESTMRYWRIAHRLLTILALVLTAVHGISVYYFRGAY